MSKDREVTLPVSVAFEKRFAELIWENCPKLARQTAAGNLALSLDVDDKSVQEVVIAALIKGVADGVRPRLMEAMKKAEKVAVEQGMERISRSVLAEMDKKMPTLLDDSVRTGIDRIIYGEMRDNLRELFIDACDRYLAEQHEAIVEVIQSRIDFWSGRQIAEKTGCG